MIVQEKSINDINQLKNGPSQHRECRDTICCLLFIANIAAMLACSIYGYSYGNSDNIFRGTDFKKNICNITTGFPYLYFYDPFNNSIANRVCVKECPTYYGNYLTQLACYGGIDCKYQYTATLLGYNITGYTGSLNGIVIGYQTMIILNRVCFPTAHAIQILNNQNKSNVLSFFYQNFRQTYLSGFISDIIYNWPVLFGAFTISVFISLLFLLFLRIFTNFVVWITIIGTLIFLTILGFCFYYSSGNFDGHILYMGYRLSTNSTNSKYLAYYAYALWVITGLLTVIVFFCSNKIRLAVSVCKCASKFIIQVGSISLVPIFMAFLNKIMWIFCIIGMIYLVTSSKFTSDGNVLTTIQSYQDISLLRFYYFIFGTIWCNELLQIITMFIISSVCSMWYYSHGPSQKIHFPILRSYGRAVRYHCGSFALGSLTLPIIQFFQLIIQILKKDTQEYEFDQNQCISNCIRCLKYFIKGLEQIVKYINTSAYIQIALTGKNFFMASKEGFELVWSNLPRYSMIGGIGNILMFFGKMMISCSTTTIAYIFIQFGGTSYNFMQPLLILILIFIYSYSIGVIFMSVYSIGMDSLLTCFMRDQVNEKEYGRKTALYVPEQLKEIVDNQ